MMNDFKVEIVDPNTEDAQILRSSTTRQQVDGDPIPIQIDKIKCAVEKNNLKVGISITMAISASGKFETQPLLKVLDYFKTQPTIKRVWCSIVNRATRGELLDFLMVRQAYSKQGIELCDAEGELESLTKDTLEAYGVDYKFNKYNSNEQKIVDAILDARRNWRSNLTQLHAAEIKYARLGYWVSGNVSEGLTKTKVHNEHGRRWVLEPDPSKALWFHTMFDLSLKKVPKTVIVSEVNKLGYRSRNNLKLTLKQLDSFLKRPIYALIRDTKSQQIGGHPIKVLGKGYLTIEQFNQINEGRINILEVEGKIKVFKGKLSARSIKTKSTNYPFKQFVLCPLCKSQLYGSAPRNKNGRHIGRYHCQKGHKYWSINQAIFDKTISDFTKNLKLTDDKLLQFKEAMVGKIQSKLITLQGVSINYQSRVTQLEEQSKELLTKIRASRLLSVQQALEEDLEKIENDKIIAIKERDNSEFKQIDLRMVINRVIYFLEHLDKGLLGIADPVKRAAVWSSVFKETPTYEDLVSGTPVLRSHVKLIASSRNKQDFNVDARSVVWNTVFESIFRLYQKLIDLGFTYYDGKVSIIETEEENSNV